MQYCPDIFQNLYIEKRNENEVNLAFCCLARISPNVTEVKQDSDWLSEQREHLLTTGNLPESCIFCSEAEKRNVKSQRMLYFDNAPKNLVLDTKLSLKKLQYNCDNVCNLKCIICSSKFSSSWIEDEEKLRKNGYEFGVNKYTDLNKKLKPTKHNTLVYDLDVSQLETIYFNGGEPLMSNDQIKFLSYVIDNTNPKKISIQINTNATWPLRDKYTKLWEKFSKVSIMCSIDGIGERFEYIRYPGNWQKVEENLLSYKQSGFDYTINPAIGIHNVLYTHELYDWALTNGYDVKPPLMVLGQLSLTNFPIKHKDYLLEYANNLIEFDGKTTLLSEIQSISNPDLRWIEYLNQLDIIRGNSWKTSLSDLYHLIYN